MNSFWDAPDSAQRISRLTALWNEGLTGQVIADVLCVEFDGEISRNAVIGKAHRLGLPSRPSPIKATGTGKYPRAARINRADREASIREALALPAIFATPEPEHTEPDPVRPGHGCQFPRGSKPDYDFCGAQRKPGSSYCPEHYAITHLKRPEPKRQPDPSFTPSHNTRIWAT